MGKKCFKNAYVVDGTGQEGFVSHVFIEDDKITAMGELREDYDGEVLDCTGLILTPGWIDAHTHNDFFLNREDDVHFFSPFALQGVTTMISGNCGFSPMGYPEDSTYKEEIGGGLFRVYPKEESYPDLKTWIQKTKRTPLNMVPLIGHGSARIGVNGKKANKLTEKQRKEMLDTIEKNLQQGAFGVSFGLMYEPGMYAPYDELFEVAHLVKKYDRILTVHNRAQSRISTSYSPPIGGRAHNLRALDEMITLAKDTEVRLQNSHLIFVGKKTIDTYKETMELIDQAIADGVDFGFDIFSLTYGASIITVILPGWYLQLSEEKRNAWFVRLRLWIEIHVAKKALGLDFSDIRIANGAGKIDQYQGMYVDEVAREMGCSPYQAYIRLVNQSEGKAGVYIRKYSTDDIIFSLVNHEKSLLMTDAWVQSRGLQNGAAYYGMIKFVLMANHAKIRLEDVIAKMTGLTAKRFQIANRGKIAEGYFADLTIFDPQELSFDADTNTTNGMKYVYVNGKKVVENNSIVTDEFANAGKILTFKK